MKHILLVLVAALGLAGCVTANGSQVAVTASTVQQKTAELCQFLPAAQVVAAITNANANKNVQTASEIATLICAAVDSSRARAPVVDGVVVTGKKV